VEEFSSDNDLHKLSSAQLVEALKKETSCSRIIKPIRNKHFFMLYVNKKSPI